MKILNPTDKIGHYKRSIFLAGPTPRSTDVKSWRPDAIEFLKKHNYKGIVFVPEREDWCVKFDYTDQVEWELEGLNTCDRILFWVPRNMKTMPGLTTNVEFGMFLKTGKIWYGRPKDAEHTRYLDHLYKKYTSHDPCEDLECIVESIVDSLDEKHYRTRG